MRPWAAHARQTPHTVHLASCRTRSVLLPLAIGVRLAAPRQDPSAVCAPSPARREAPRLAAVVWPALCRHQPRVHTGGGRVMRTATLIRPIRREWRLPVQAVMTSGQREKRDPAHCPHANRFDQPAFGPSAFLAWQARILSPEPSTEASDRLFRPRTQRADGPSSSVREY